MMLLVLLSSVPHMSSQLPQGDASRIAGEQCLGCMYGLPKLMINVSRSHRFGKITTKAKMVQQRAFSLLSSAERHLFRQTRSSTGQHIRCIHTSNPVKASENTSESNDNGTPYNAPKRGPNRQERAAKVSSEVSALAADLPTANLSGRNAEVEGAQSKSPGISPQSQGMDGPGRMGEHENPRKEGPFAQGVGRVVRGSDEDPTYSKEARGIRTPNSRLETPAEGGASVMEPMGRVPEAPVSSEPNAGTAEAPATTTTKSTTSRPVAPAKEVSPSKSSQTIERYLHTGSGTSTLSSSNFPGMIIDRAALLSPRSSPSTPTTSEIAHRLRNYPKQLTAFRSQAEKEAFFHPRQALQTKVNDLLNQLGKEKKTNGAGTVLATDLQAQIDATRKQLPPSTKFRPLPQSVQQDIVNRMVLGKYDEQGLLSGKAAHKQQPLLDVVARELLKNSTYLAKDSAQLMSRLRGLLPTAAAASAASKKPAAKAKA
jgi:hypothetical protein